MRIDDLITRCVVFLCRRRVDDGVESYEMIGTAFLVLYEPPPPDIGGVYLVTARHCLAGAGAYGGIYARVNLDKGGIEHRLLNGTWLESETDDVAATRIHHLSGWDVGLFPHSMLGREELLSARRVGLGDETVTCGLFAAHPGKARNYPIVRSGIIAAMPNEPIRTVARDGREFEAPGYLIEARSLGGLSGSPVIVMFRSHRHDDGSVTHVGGDSVLLGLIRGHWDFRAEVPAEEPPTEALAQVHQGIAVVAPAIALLNLLKLAGSSSTPPTP